MSAGLASRPLALALLAAVAGACGRGQELPPDDVAYLFVNELSGRCLDVEAGGRAEGTAVMQWECSSGRAHQRWHLVPLADGTVRIVARHSDRCLSVAPPEAPNPGYAVQRACDPAGADAGQRWRLRRLRDGTYNVTSADRSECLDVEASGTEDGALVLRYACAGNAGNQKWALTPLAPALGAGGAAAATDP